MGDPQQLNLYAYARGNPLKYTDPTGLEVEIAGQMQDEYLKRLNARKNQAFKTAILNGVLTIVDSKGKALNQKQLNALGKTLSGGEAALFEAITDKTTRATIDTGDGKANPDVVFGQATSKGKNTLDFSDIKLLDAPENAGGTNTGSQIVAHETLEAYQTAKGLPGFPQPGGGANAHDQAGQHFPGYDFSFGAINYDAPDAKGNVGGFTDIATQQGTSGQGTRTTLTYKFVTPVPAASLPQGRQVWIGVVRQQAGPFNLTKVEAQR